MLYFKQGLTLPIILLLCFFSGLVSADTPDSSNSAISLYSHANRVYQKISSGDEHQFLLSTPKRISNALFIEKEVLLSGERNNLLLRVKASGSSKKAFSYYKQLFVGQGDVLYSCEERACGSSNYWANSIFNERLLYGRDSEQYYLAGRLSVEGQNYFVSIYITKNGKKQEYIYLSYVLDKRQNPKPANIKALENLSQLSTWQQGVPYEKGLLKEESVAFIKQALRRDKALSMWIVGFNDISKGQKLLDEMNATEKSLNNFKIEISQQFNINAERIMVKNIEPFGSKETKGLAGTRFQIYLL
ncbi:MAG: hypothetical protein ACI9T7_000301 [Oleiphilaceae bacterium]|jgi:hypothetical protein